MDNYIEGDYLVYDCGCRFKILEGMPNLRVEIPTDITKIRKDCERTWRIFAEGNTKGIFQLETRFGQQYSKKLMPENIEHLAGLMSILRPSCLNAISNGKSVTDSYIDRKNNVEESISAHPALENILDKTYHQNIYQEQSLQISREIAGFSLQQADILRKCLSRGSFVNTDKGKIKIEDLSRSLDGHKILTVDLREDFIPLYLPIYGVWYSGIQNTLRFTTISGKSVRLTYKHKVYTDSCGWTEAENLRVGDLVVVFNSAYDEIKNETIVRIEDAGEIETYDYEVDDENIHYGFIDDIVVANSIGKKRADLMAKSKEEFIEGAKKTGIVDEETAEIIFGWIESASRYGFNKCVSPDTTVETYDGHTKTIDEISIGEYIDSPDGYVEVVNKYENGIQDLYEIELEDGKTIECTMNHKFLCEDNIVRPLYEIISMEIGIICES